MTPELHKRIVVLLNKHLYTASQTLNDLTNRIARRWNSHTTPQVVPGTDPSQNFSMEDAFRQLIAMPTVTGNGQAMAVALDYLASFFETRGLHIERIVRNGVDSLVATTRKTKTPHVMLAAHLDVVPGDPSLFELTEKDGKYFGRGTFDMKFAIAAYMKVIDDIKDNLAAYDLGIMVTTDEEVGGADGVGYLVDAGYIPKVVVLPDGGDNWAIETFAKGLWHVTLSTKGRSAHGSRPWEGSSATEKLIAMLGDIKALFPNMNPDASTVNVGIIRGGKAINQIPDSASASLDIRTASVEDDKRIQAAVTDIAKRYEAKITTEIYAAPCINDPANPYLQAFSSSIKHATGIEAGHTMSFAASDARFFSPKGVPCVIVRPPGGGHHGPNEWLSKEGFLQLHTIIGSFVEKTARL